MFFPRPSKLPKPLLIWVALVTTCTASIATGEKSDQTKTRQESNSKASVRNRKLLILSDKGIPLRPLSVLACQNDLYFLCPQSVWKVGSGVSQLSQSSEGREPTKLAPSRTKTQAQEHEQKQNQQQELSISKNQLRCSPVIAIGTKVGQTPIHEFSAFTYVPEKHAIYVVDKSGDILKLDTTTGLWSTAMQAGYLKASPDPDLIDLVPVSDSLAFLDPESRHVWNLIDTPGQAQQALKLVKASSLPSLASATNIAYNRAFYISWRNGAIQSNSPVAKPERSSRHSKKAKTSARKAAGKSTAAKSKQAPKPDQKSETSRNLPATKPPVKELKPQRSNTVEKKANANLALPTKFTWRPPQILHASRLYLAPSGLTYLVEADKNRVILLDKESAKLQQFTFNASADLRGMLVDKDGFWIVNRSVLERRNLDQKESFSSGTKIRKPDARLGQFILPMKKVHLPFNFGALPGTRRPYRYGVHEGIDFFVDSACQSKVEIGTEVRACASGKVVRADTNFKEMSRGKFLQVLAQCRKEHATSSTNEDLFRGQQVWIDHGGGCMTRYAHLSKISDRITKGCTVKKGDLIAYVGVSGTQGAYPGQSRHPHLHFEIWLDGKYLGWGMTPQETLFVLEDIFGCGCK